MKKIFFIINMILYIVSSFSQNIGISNDASFISPQSPLHIYWTNDGNLLQLSKSGTSNSGLLFSVNTNNYSILNKENGDLIFGTNNSEYIRIKNNGNIGIGTNNPTAQLHTTGTVRFSNYVSGANGAILRTNNLGELSITNFSGVDTDILLGNGTFGDVNNIAWKIIGNSGTNPTINFIGTTDNVDFSLRTNNIERMRAKSTGEFIIGGLDPGMSGDLFSVISTNTLPWSINGYANNDGGAFYIEISNANNTNYSTSEIHNNGTGTGFCLYATNNSTNTSASSGTAIYGESSVGHSGNNYFLNNFAGIYGVGAFGFDQYSFGVIGIMYGIGTRSGGILGSYDNTRFGSLGYVRSNGNVYGLCYVGGATTIAKTTNNIHYSIGMGGWGDLMGGHITGEIYGLHVKGERYSLYVDGTQFINKTIVQLNEIKNSNDRIPSYMTTSLNKDIIDKGVAEIILNKETKIYFDENFSKIIDTNNYIIITVSPIGYNISAYIVSYDKYGFIVKCERTNTQIQENKNQIKLNWIAIARLNDNITLPNEILTKSYDENMNNFLVNEADTNKKAVSMWWNGQNLIFDSQPFSNSSKIAKTKQDLIKELNIYKKSNYKNK